MTNSSRCTRRQILQVTGSAAVVGLAGCTGALTNDEQEESAPTDTPADDHDENHDDEAGNQEEEEHNEEEEEHHEEEEEHHEEEEEHQEEDEHNEEGDGHDDEHEGEDENGHNHDEGTPQEPSGTAKVKLQTEANEQHFAPHVVWVEPGGTVTWVNESGQHDSVAYHPDNGDKPLRMPEEAKPWDTGLLTEEGESASHTFETEGVYDYFCTPHEAVGMVGTVIVGEPDAHGQPALEDPQESLPDGARSELEDLGHRVNESLGHTHD